VTEVLRHRFGQFVTDQPRGPSQESRARTCHGVEADVKGRPLSTLGSIRELTAAGCVERDPVRVTGSGHPTGGQAAGMLAQAAADQTRAIRQAIGMTPSGREQEQSRRFYPATADDEECRLEA